MGIEMLSGSKRSTFLNRVERREKQHVIATAVVEMLEDELTDKVDETERIKTEQAEAERRHYILHGHHPADGHQLRTYELDELTASLGELSPAEREKLHTTTESIIYYEMLSGWICSMDPDPFTSYNPLDELVDDGSAADYYQHDYLDQAMI